MAGYPYNTASKNDGNLLRNVHKNSLSTFRLLPASFAGVRQILSKDAHVRATHRLERKYRPRP
eukprot:1166014-Amphidinium_carterae.1